MCPDAYREALTRDLSSPAPPASASTPACPPELAVQRYNARATHPVHVVTTLQLEAMAEYDRPVGIGALVTVDTTVTVDMNAVASAVRLGLHGRGGGVE